MKRWLREVDQVRIGEARLGPRHVRVWKQDRGRTSTEHTSIPQSIRSFLISISSSPHLGSKIFPGRFSRFFLGLAPIGSWWSSLFSGEGESANSDDEAMGLGRSDGGEGMKR